MTESPTSPSFLSAGGKRTLRRWYIGILVSFAIAIVFWLFVPSIHYCRIEDPPTRPGDICETQSAISWALKYGTWVYPFDWRSNLLSVAIGVIVFAVWIYLTKTPKHNG